MVPLGEVVQRVSDVVQFTERVQPRELPDERWYVGLENIEGGGTGAANPLPLSVANDLRSAKTAFGRGDILYGRLRPYLNKVWLADRDGLCSTEILVLRSKWVDAAYLRHFIASRLFVEAAAARQKGSSLPRVPWEEVATIPMPLPRTVDEQSRIADLLDEALSVQRICATACGETERFLDALFVEFFGGPGLASRKWRSSTLDTETVEVLSGLQVSPGRVAPSGVPYLRVANVQRRHVSLDEIKFMRLTDAELRAKALRKGDVLIIEGHGNREELGRAAVWSGSLEPCVHQNHVIRLRILRDNFIPEYLSEYINSAIGRAYFESVGRTTSGLNTISVRDVRHMPILVPPIDRQQRFADCVRAAVAVRERLVAQEQQAEALYRALVEQEILSRSASPAALSSWPEVESAPPAALMNRLAYHKLSRTQRQIVDTTYRIAATSFKLDEVADAFECTIGKAPNREHLLWALDLLTTLGILIRENRNGFERWRRPDEDDDREIDA